MMALPLTATITLASLGDTVDETVDLLQVAAVLVLVVFGVLALTYLIRPLLPPVPAAPNHDEEGERTLPRPGLDHGTVETTPRRGDVVALRADRREPAFDEADRAYRDPVVAARLKHVLGADRRGGRRRLGPPTASASPPTPTALGPRLLRGDDEGRVGHTGPEPAPPGDRPANDQEPDTMPSSDLDTPAPSFGDHGGSRPPETIEGSPPSAADLDRLTTTGPQPRAKVVPFVPRPSAASSGPDEAVDAAVVAAITSTVRELLFCANVGEYLHGFALYTDRYLFRFMDDTGMTVDEFRATFEAAPAREADDWTRLAGLRDARRLDDGRVSAAVTYEDGEMPGGTETYTFAFAPDRGLWLIDDIAQT